MENKNLLQKVLSGSITIEISFEDEQGDCDEEQRDCDEEQRDCDEESKASKSNDTRERDAYFRERGFSELEIRLMSTGIGETCMDVARLITIMDDGRKEFPINNQGAEMANKFLHVIEGMINKLICTTDEDAKVRIKIETEY